MIASHPVPPLWTPTAERRARTRLLEFTRAARAWGAPPVERPEFTIDYEALHTWSVDRREEFWPAVWDYCGIIADHAPRRGRPEDAGVGLDRMAPPDREQGPRWFPQARLNFAENLLRRRDAHPALVSWTENGPLATFTGAELYTAVARAAAALRALGIAPGDRVAAWLPNIPEAVIAMLATASLGAVWSSSSPDFGVGALVDRFGQIEPRVFLMADGYRVRGTTHDCLARAGEIVSRMPTIEQVVVVAHAARAGGAPGAARDRRGALPPLPGAVWWDDWLRPAGEVPFERLPFDHPLYIMYSSGTTGLPKCMVHGAGGTLLQHQKEHVLHTDLGPEDRIFYHTTCGWMMWNWLVSALAVGATVVLYDGSPVAPHADVLWELAERERITVLGTSAKYLALAEKAATAPVRTRDLEPLRTILSTGSPLTAASFDYVYRDIKRDVHLASISGGTDLISCWVLGNPLAPVWRGEMQAAGLGMAVEVWGPSREPLRSRPGELVCPRPFPSMPVAFWNDRDGALYRAAYFDWFPGAWRHGDWIETTRHGGYIILGRSDATLNPAGVRIGTAEIYRQVEQLAEVVESVAVGEELGGPGDVRIVLFVRLQDGLALDEPLRERIRRRLREQASPYHVPRVIAQVSDIPRTISGKISEVAVRETIHGRPVTNADALANPESLAQYRDRPELARR